MIACGLCDPLDPFTSPVHDGKDEKRASDSKCHPLPPPSHTGPLAFVTASDEEWEYRGLPLSVLKRLFRDKFVNRSHDVCEFCGKSGHSVSCCPLSTANRCVPPSDFLRSVFLCTCDDSEMRDALRHSRPRERLRDAISWVDRAGAALNRGNPFASNPETSLWALPKRVGWWKAIGAPNAVLSWIAYGYQLRFLQTPPRVGFANHPGSSQYCSFVDEELSKRVERGQFSIVSSDFALQLHPLDVVPKASGGYRLILDCRLINGFLPDVYFKLENLAVVPQVVEKGAFLFSTDLEDAYFHIPMHPQSRPHLCFRWRDKTYTTNVLPFGLSLAPWVFTKLLRPVIRFCRSLDISVIAYLDDFLWSASQDSISDLIEFARSLLSLLGFSVSEKKSEWTPSQALQFLGLIVNAESYQFEVPKEKVVKILDRIRSMREQIASSKRPTARAVAAVCGLIMSARLAVAPARIYTRALYHCLNEASGWNSPIALSEAAVSELDFWSRHLTDYKSQGMIPARSVLRMHCDASEDGWGAHCIGAAAFGRFEEKELLTSSTYRELLGLLHAIRSPLIRYAIANRRVTFVLDSQAATYNLLKGGGPKPDLSLLVKQIWDECVSCGADATAEWIPREENAFADALSKLRDRSDWQINPHIFDALNDQFGPFDIDRFAAAHNTQCEVYNSLHYDAGAAATDAFKQDWSGSNNFCNPPFDQIDRVLHAQECKAKLTLIYPEWPSAPWFNRVQRSAHAIVQLPRLPDTFIPGPRSAHLILTHPKWNVFAACFDFGQTTRN